MPTLAAPLDLAKLEARNLRAHQLGSAPSSPVTGQLYYNTGDNTLYWWDGTAWQSAKGGAMVDATTSTKGAVQLAGDLAGTAASPQIAAGAVVDADVNASAAIAESKLALATDAAAGTGSRRTLGSGALQAMPGNRTLDAITAPAADLSLNSHKITSLLDPTAAQDAATKSYVDAALQGLQGKASVQAASTVDVPNLSSPPATFDGVTVANFERVLLKNQATPAQNGIYMMSGGILVRTSDANAWSELVSAYVFVEQGTTQADTGWLSTADDTGTLGTTAVNWVQFSAAGQILGGAGLLKTGNTLDVGAGTGISVGTDTISVDSAIIPRYYSSATHGAGTSISIPQSTHGCRASRGLIVMTVVEATGAEVLADVVVAANGDVTITFSASQSANTIRTTIVG